MHQASRGPKTPVIDDDHSDDAFGTPPETPSGLSVRRQGKKRCSGDHVQSPIGLGTASFGSSMPSFDISFGSSHVEPNASGPANGVGIQSFESTTTAPVEDLDAGDDQAEESAAKRRRLENCHYQIRRLRTAGLFCDDAFPPHLACVPIRQAVEGTRIALEAGLPAYRLLSPAGTSASFPN